MRLFFALWPDDAVRTRLAGVAGTLHLPGRARYVPRENYHLTLAFVGEVAKSQVGVLQQIGSDQPGCGCTITFDSYDYWREPQVAVTVAREPPAALIELAMRLRHDLGAHAAALIAHRPDSPLRAHVTLARKVAQAPVLPAMSAFSWSARSFALVRSDTSGAHSVYTVVDTWPLLYAKPNP